MPKGACALVIFAHGSGSGKNSPRNKMVAAALNKKKIATLLFDLLTPKENKMFANRFRISFLVKRLEGATAWAEGVPELQGLPVAYFGASTGAAAAIIAAARAGKKIKTVISRGGRPDLAIAEIGKVKAPILFLVGSIDPMMPENKKAYAQASRGKKFIIIPGAGHIFEEKGTMDMVVKETVAWFEKHL